MMDYKSPIEIAIGQFRLEQEKRIEGDVLSAIQEYGITIDKEELIKALNYDRDQYRKGYEDGVRAKADNGDVVKVVRCKDCKHCTLTEDGEYNPEDVVCGFFMTDGMQADDYCSYGERREP